MVNLLAFPRVALTSKPYQFISGVNENISVQGLVGVRVLVQASVPPEQFLVRPTTVLGQTHPQSTTHLV